jgi:Rrf2 family protein
MGVSRRPIRQGFEGLNGLAPDEDRIWRDVISYKAKYAIKAVLALAAQPDGGSMVISEIAERESIPKKFLEQILLDLKHQGLVMSRRGKHGGYMLLKPADQTTFGEVLRVIDGPLAPLPCLSKMAYHKCEDCADEATCRVRRVFADVAEATRGVLDRTTIADALAGEGGESVRRAVS